MFKILNEDNNARIGLLKTAHGEVQTPAFMPVATKASVKTLTSQDLYDLGFESIITNAYHLYLKPGLDTIEKFGSIHKYMNFDKTIFTDSGGFQMIRKGFFIKATEEGILFKSPYDGKKHFFTPEKSKEVQEKLGGDVAMALDHCPSYPSKPDKIEKSVELTTLWAKKFIDAHKKKDQLIFAIVQGGTSKELRKKSAEQLVNLNFSGYALGGLSIGEPKDLMADMVKNTVQYLPEEKPRYLMGLGSPLDIVDSVENGIDIFDSVFPTRNARHGTILTFDGVKDFRKKIFKDVLTPIEKDCQCFTCKNYSSSYVHHLLKEKELSGMRLTTIHNLQFIQNLMEKMRDSIKNGTFSEFKKSFRKRFIS